MKHLFFTVMVTITALTTKAQCEPEHTFYPAATFSIGTKPDMNVQVGLQGQRTPFSFYGGVRSYEQGRSKAQPYQVGIEPYLEINNRVFFTDPLGIFLYVNGSIRSQGGGIGVNYRLDEQFGFRVKAGWEERLKADVGFILIFHRN